MRKYLTIVIGLLLSTFFGYAKTYTVEDLPVATQGGSEIYVCNPDGILSAEVVSLLCDKLATLDDSTGIQTLVVAVDSISPSDAFTWGVELGTRLGVGKKGHDSGLIFLLVKGQRDIYIIPGTGIESKLPDILCDRIIVDKMIPSFKLEKWNQGMVNGVFAAYDILIDVRGEFDDDKSKTSDYYIWLCLFGVVGLILYLRYRANKCPDCGQQLKVIDRRTWREGSYIEKEKVTCQCPNCKRIVYRLHTYDHSPSSSGSYRSGGGGGFSGGGRSFGGGGFSGGGAGRHF